jgi:hypothetical protein
MAGQAGVNLTSGRFQVTSSGAARQAQAMIDNNLHRFGVAGGIVAHNGGRRHAILIDGKGVDAQGRTYYTYKDPGTVHRQFGDNPGRNRLYVDNRTGMLFRNGENPRGPAYTQNYRLAAVMGVAGAPANPGFATA